MNKNKSKKTYASEFKIKKKKNYYLYKDQNHKIPILSKTIHSEGLINNLGLAIKVALDFGVPKKIIIKTIPKIQFEGRVQYLIKGKFKKLIYFQENLLIDGCHSIASAENLYNYLKTVKEPIYGIWGMQKNKMPELFIKSFNKIFKKIVTVTIPNQPNALKAEKLRSISQKYMPSITAPNIKAALKRLSSEEKKTIVIFGSLYLTGEILSRN